MSSFYEVMIERNFSSAHQLRGYKGKCENLHGHNYKIEIYARGEELNNIGLLIDFVDLKAAADEIVKYLDHRNINELPPFDEELNPSAENLARYILEYVNGRVADERVQFTKFVATKHPRASRRIRSGNVLERIQTNRRLLVLAILAVWTAFGLFFGTQQYVRDVYVGTRQAFPVIW